MIDHSEFEETALPVLLEYAAYRVSQTLVDTSVLAEELVEVFRESRMGPKEFVAAFIETLKRSEGSSENTAQPTQHEIHDIAPLLWGLVLSLRDSVVNSHRVFDERESLVYGLD